MMMQTVLLTGSTGDIGEAILKKFQDQNYYVIAPHRKELDLQQLDSIDSFFSSLKNSVDIFIHCAGFNDPKLILDLSLAEVQKTFQINAFSFYTMCQQLLKKGMTAGSIVAISSLYGEFSRKGRLAYAASKHALNGMVKTLALELGEKNIKVNSVSPGFVDTKMTRKNNSDDVIESFKRKIPLGRLAKTTDIAEVVYFLCSPLNNYINGQCILVDGGFSAGGFQE